MNTNKVLYWVVLGVFAVGLHSEYRNGRFPAIHRVAGHAGSTVCRLVSRAERAVALARVVTSPPPFTTDELLASARDREFAQAELLRDEARARADLLQDQVRAQADLIRARAELQQSQIEQICWHTRSQFKLTNATTRRVTLICPKTGARIAVNAGPSDIEVGDTFWSWSVDTPESPQLGWPPRLSPPATFAHLCRATKLCTVSIREIPL